MTYSTLFNAFILDKKRTPFINSIVSQMHIEICLILFGWAIVS